MFGNTFVLPHADGNITCVKVNQDQYSSEYRYRSALQEVAVKIRHSTTKGAAPKDRHNVEVTQTVYETESTAELQRKFYVVLEQTPSDLDVKLVDSLCDWLIATANANVSSLLQWES